MIFALSTDDRTLTAFPTEADAIAYCEGVDVEDGVWLFFASDGKPLAPRFTTANRHGLFSVVSGSYVLDPASSGVHLRDVLKGVAAVDGLEFTCTDDVRRHLDG